MHTQPLRVIITGSTGMVGEGVLHTCLIHPDVEAVLVVNRKPCGVVHPKLKEIIHSDFFDLTPIEDQLAGYNACFFCLGVSSVGMSADEYYRLTYTLTLQFAQLLSRLNPAMIFCYVSGAGTDSTEQGRIGWARVKGKTENELRKLPFRQVFAFRPGFIQPLKGMQHTHSYYTYITWLFPVGRALYPKGFCRLDELALAMIHVVKKGYPKNILEGDDIILAAKL
ncbi:epimerase [Telluribacter sp. SYSU D00476]|uniref:epimerase n=1 Tax=Telluribacter sp. SYSU D00476 TaxID=2811430 RepID=UPI001FF20C1D|nr:epimerase [Telluribacter sp. SYSU D00476]